MQTYSNIMPLFEVLWLLLFFLFFFNLSLQVKLISHCNVLTLPKCVWSEVTFVSKFMWFFCKSFTVGLSWSLENRRGKVWGPIGLLVFFTSRLLTSSYTCWCIHYSCYFRWTFFGSTAGSVLNLLNDCLLGC